MCGWTFAGSRPRPRATELDRIRGEASMDVILLEDLNGVGAKGAIVHVKPGYARNYLLPQKLAIAAGSNAAGLYQELERQRTIRDDRLIVAARAEASKLDGV